MVQVNFERLLRRMGGPASIERMEPARDKIDGAHRGLSRLG